MSSSRYATHRQCSTESVFHRIDGGICEEFEVLCKKCGAWTPAVEKKCAGCRAEMVISTSAISAMTHPRDMIVCPSCGRRLRLRPRDKRRSSGLKRHS